MPTLALPLVPALFWACTTWLGPSSPPPFLRSTVWLYTLATAVELVSEPFYLKTLLRWEILTSSRVKIEGLAVAGKAVATIFTVWRGGENFALVSFGVGQFAYSLVILLGLIFITWDSAEQLDAADDVAGNWFDQNLMETSQNLTKQSIVKQILTEADKLAVGRMTSLKQQGGYAVALNYGSLVARLLFQPIEEACRLYFSRELSAPTNQNLLRTANLLSGLLLMYTHLSAVFILILPSYTSPLLFHLLGPRWANSSAPAVLRAYCAYLPFLALNGLTEAFFQSVADPSSLSRGSQWLGMCSIAYIGAAAVGFHFQYAEKSLIFANCVNMSLRISFSSQFIRNYYKIQIAQLKLNSAEQIRLEQTLTPRAWLPKIQTLFALIFARIWVKHSENTANWKTLRGFGQHLFAGMAAGIICVIIM